MSNYETNPVGALQVCNQGYQEKNAKKSYYASKLLYNLQPSNVQFAYKKINLVILLPWIRMQIRIHQIL